MQIYAPSIITEKEISMATEALRTRSSLCVTFNTYNKIIDSPQWPEFASLINANPYLQFVLSSRLDKDPSGNYYKSWGDLSFLKDLPDTKKFHLHSNANHLENLRWFNSLKGFSIENRGPVMDLNPLLKFKDSLNYLMLEGNLKHVDILKEFKSLKKLSLHSGIKKFDFQLLEGMKELETLSFVRGIEFVNTDIFKELRSIKHLGVHFNPKLDSLSFIEQSEFLETFSVTSSGNFKQLPNLSQLKSLHSIGLETTGRIENLNEIKNAPALKSFSYWFPKNEPEDFAFLKDMWLENCQIAINSNKKQRQVNQYINNSRNK